MGTLDEVRLQNQLTCRSTGNAPVALGSYVKETPCLITQESRATP
jgi:hypothetical protein